MIVAFSTSSPRASIAVFDRVAGVIWQGFELAPMAASGACMRLLERMMADTGLRLDGAELFAADLGPGSFTGVRVGVTLAKTFGYLYGRPVAGASSFDLISADETVVLPSKKKEFFIRRPGMDPFRSVDLPDEPFVGFGHGIEPETYPEASRFFQLIEKLVPRDALAFVPEYLIEPSISVPKKPFPTGVRSDG